MNSDALKNCVRLAACLVVCGLGLTGCSRDSGPVAGREPTVPVSGVVLMDGEPLGGATVLFHSQSTDRTSSGRTDATGRFELTTFESGDGAVAGQHKVTVQKVEQKTTPHPEGDPYPPTVEEIWHTPKQYADMATSPLEVEIGADGDSELKLSIESDGS